MQNPKSSVSFKNLLLCFTVMFTVCFVRVERVQFTNRFHLVMHQGIERKAAEIVWITEELMVKEGERVLPATDPAAIRVGSIARGIVQALHSGLRVEWECNVNGVCSEGKSSSKGHCHKVVERSEKRARKLRWKPSTTHLNGMNWEVSVVDSYTGNAFSARVGKIFVYKGFLRQVNSDAELAWVLAHEVGHALARHFAERLVKYFCALILLLYFLGSILGRGKLVRHGLGAERLILLCLLGSILPYGELVVLILNRIERRRELEADYIGLMLMASAGYEPREAPKIIEKFGGTEADFFATHPSGLKRVKLLKKPEVMEDAVAICNEARAGCGVRSFL